MNDRDIRTEVRKRYGGIASRSGSCCGDSSCCSSQSVGYTPEDIASIPDGSEMGLGCGNPLALAAVEEGMTVLDLGSGAGIDCFLAARRVGESGRVIGVDMTPEMLEKARANAAANGFDNVEFRLGEIESLPVADSTVDLVISNCVINLSVDKAKVFREILRVLKPGGSLMISDIVLLRELPDAVRESAAAYAQCVAGASLKDEYLGLIGQAGFVSTEVLKEFAYGAEIIVDGAKELLLQETGNLTEERVKETAGSIVSISVSAKKPE